MMKTWLDYDFLRRWWLLLVLGLGLGALGGLGYFLQQDRTGEYKATARFFIDKETEFNVVSDAASTERAAVEHLATLANKLEKQTGSRVVIGDVLMERRYETVWWQPTVLGSVIGALLAIAAIILWQDTQTYARHRQ